MEKVLFAVSLCLGLSVPVSGQSVDCGNIGFEQGTTSGWVMTTGTVTNSGTQIVYANETAGIYANGHVVTKLSDGNDQTLILCFKVDIPWWRTWICLL